MSGADECDYGDLVYPKIKIVQILAHNTEDREMAAVMEGILNIHQELQKEMDVRTGRSLMELEQIGLGLFPLSGGHR